MPSLLCTALTLNSKHVNNTRIQSSRRSPMVYQFSAQPTRRANRAEPLNAVRVMMLDCQFKIWPSVLCCDRNCPSAAVLCVPSSFVIVHDESSSKLGAIRLLKRQVDD